MENFEKMLWWLIGGTKGGKNRLRIIMALKNRPMNTNSLAKHLDLDYKTVGHHLEKLEKNDVVETMGDGYGKNYFITDKMEKNISVLNDIGREMGVET